MALLTATQLRLSYGDLDVFAGIDLEVTERDRIGVVGPNGGGKTSLLRILIGELEPDGGAVTRPDGVRIGYVPQTPERGSDGSLRQGVMAAFDGAATPSSPSSPPARWPCSKRRARTAARRHGATRPCSTSTRLSAATITRAAWRGSSRASACHWTPSIRRRTRPAVGSARGQRSPGRFWSTPTCWCWTSPQTIWTSRVSLGSKGFLGPLLPFLPRRLPRPVFPGPRRPTGLGVGPGATA